MKENKIVCSIMLIIRGLGNLHYCGDHPGTIPLLGILSLTTIAGGWKGLYMASIAFIPLYLVGAYNRAKAEEVYAKEAEKDNLF